MTKLITYDALWEYQTGDTTALGWPNAETVPVGGWLGPEPGPFGDPGGDYITDRPAASLWPLNEGLWIRRNVVLDGLAPVLLTGHIENNCYIFWDGEQIAAVNANGAQRPGVPFWAVIVPIELATAGTHEIALLCQDEAATSGTDITYISVEAEYCPPLFPFWPRPGVRETLQWVTEVTILEDGGEDRSQMRLIARDGLGMSVFIPPLYQPLAKNLLRGKRTSRWMVPFWPHLQQIGAVTEDLLTLTCDPDFRDFRVGEYACLWQSPDDYQLLGIDTIGASSITFNQPTRAFTDALLIPVRAAILTGDPSRDIRGWNSAVQVQFMCDGGADWSGDAPDQYLDNDIYFDESLFPGRLPGEEVQGQVGLFDEALGGFDHLSPWIRNRQQRSKGFMAEDLEEGWDIRQFLHRRAGRFRPFWLPSFERDFTVLSTGALTTTLLVRNDEYLQNVNGRTHIAIETAADGWMARTIEDAAESDPGEIVLTLDSSLDCDASEILRVCWLGLYRLDADRVEINWPAVQTSVSSPPIVEIGS